MYRGHVRGGGSGEAEMGSALHATKTRLPLHPVYALPPWNAYPCPLHLLLVDLTRGPSYTQSIFFS